MTRKITRRASWLMTGAALAAAFPRPRRQPALPDKTLKILGRLSGRRRLGRDGALHRRSLKQRTGRNVIIDNKTGASGTLAGEALKNSPPDGTTVCYMPSATVVQKLTMPSIPFDPQTDLMPVTLAGTVQTAFCVRPLSVSTRSRATSNG